MKKYTLRSLLLAISSSFVLSACCTLKQPEVAKYAEENKELNAIYHFAFDSDVLSDEDKPALDEFVEFLQANPELKAHVDGFTDHQGPQQYNLALGLRRAQAVSSYLAEKGIAPERIEVQSYGADQFLDESKTVEANAKNRRAVIYVEDENQLA
ncbi:MAG: OmpA family protein [Proteobacteria bacterium]|nr:OmpA family protein [Pseudomonadota bacterium]